jgi:cell division protein FtsN
MRNLKILLLVSVISLASCKTQRIAPKPEPVVQETVAKSEVSTKPSKSAPVASKEERFTVAKGENADYGDNKYFVILGSFSVVENAKRLKETLASENFHPVILLNENGMYRVCGNSYADEGMARSRIAEIREKFTSYKDVWLLIKKQ